MITLPKGQSKLKNKMKKEKTTLIQLGYYKPKMANWSYRVWMIIDKTGSRLYRETFGGDYRLKRKLEEEGREVIKDSPGRGTSVEYRWRDIKDLQDIEKYPGKNW